MNDIHALSGAYAIDALDEIERARFERHLADCGECQAEVESLREASALLAETTAVTPPPGLRERVLADIGTVRPLPPLQPPVAIPTTGGPRRWLTGLVAAAAVLTAIGAGAVVWAPWSEDTSQTPALSAMEQVLQAEDAERVTETLPGGVEATLVRSKSLNRAVLVTENMPPAPTGKVYEVWLQHPEDGMVPAGLMPADADSMVLDGDPASAVAAGITVEPAGGSTVPTSEPVMLFSFENA